MGHMVTGVYRVYEDGELISENSNVVTTFGKRELLNILAGRSDVPAQIMIGVAPTPGPSASDDTLKFPVAYEPIVYATPIFDGLNSKIVYKARVNTPGYFEIHEIGISNAVVMTTPLIFSFGPDEPLNTTGTLAFDETQSRVGGAAMTVLAADTATIESSVNLTAAAPQDELLLGAYAPSGAPTVDVTIYDDSDNTATATFGPFSTTWSASAVKLTDFTVTSFNWSSISKVELDSSADINLDVFAIRSPSMHGNIMSRAVYGTALERKAGARIDIEYELGIDLS